MMRRLAVVFAWSLLICFAAQAASYAASPAYDYENSTSTGVQQILSYGEAAPKLITGMDATGLTEGVPATVELNLWVSANQGGVAKRLVAKVHQGGPNGPVVATHDFPAAAVDSTAGHEYQWQETLSVTPTGTRISVSIGPSSGYVSVNSYSDTRVFTVHQDAVEDTGGGTTGPTCTTEEPCVMSMETEQMSVLLLWAALSAIASAVVTVRSLR